MAWILACAWWLQGWRRAAWLAGFTLAGWMLSRPLGAWLARRAARGGGGGGVAGAVALAWTELPTLLAGARGLARDIRGSVWRPSTWGPILDRWVDLLAERVRWHSQERPRT